MIRVDNITVMAGTFALRNASLEVPSGSCGALMGRTGCGKSKLLEASLG